MNAQTATVIAFQGPRCFKKTTSIYERPDIFINFKKRIASDKGTALCRELGNHLSGVLLHNKKVDELGFSSKDGRTHWECANSHAHEAVGLIEGLFLYGAITMTERTRLLTLFSGQLGLFEHTEKKKTKG